MAKKKTVKAKKQKRVGEVMHKWKAGDLHSGSKKGPIVRSQKQAVAIALSESDKIGKKGKKKGKGKRKK